MLPKKNRLLNALFSLSERRRLRRSFDAPFIAGTGRDSFEYYENGRAVQIYAEMMRGPIARRIHPQTLKWNDTGEVLSPAKQAEVLARLCEYFGRHNITWETYSAKQPVKRT